MRKGTLVVVGWLLIGLIGCGGASTTSTSKPKETKAAKAKQPAKPKIKDLIVGKWESEEPDLKEVGGKMVVEYKPDGKVAVKMGPVTLDATYKFVSEDVIEMSFGPAGKEKADQMKVEIKGNELTTTSLDDTEVKTFTRVK